MKLEDGLIDLDDPASTHLNLCATLSEMNRHDKAARHADLALRSLLEKLNVPADVSPDDIPEEQKELAGLLAVAFYNLGVEQEALDMPEQGLASIDKGAALALKFCGQPMHKAMEDRKGTLAKRVEVIVADRMVKQAAAEAAGDQGYGQQTGQTDAHAPQPPPGQMGATGGMTGGMSSGRRTKKRTFSMFCK